MTKVRTYVGVVFDNDSLLAGVTQSRSIALEAAPLVQLSNARLKWLIVKYHNITYSRYVTPSGQWNRFTGKLIHEQSGTKQGPQSPDAGG